MNTLRPSAPPHPVLRKRPPFSLFPGALAALAVGALALWALSGAPLSAQIGAEASPVPTQVFPEGAYRLIYHHFGQVLRSDRAGDRFDEYIRLSDGGIEILQGHSGDALRIEKINPRDPSPPTIPFLIAPAGLRILDSQGPIAMVASEGAVRRMTIRGPVEFVDVGEAEVIRIVASQREPAWTSIWIDGPTAPRNQETPTTIRLAGIGLDNLDAPQVPFASVASASQVGSDEAGRFVSAGGIGRVGSRLDALRIQRLQATGGAIVTDAIALTGSQRSGTIRAAGATFNLGRPAPSLPFVLTSRRGDILINRLDAPGADRTRIVATGGDIGAGSYAVGHRIDAISAQRRRLAGDWTGGHVGPPNEPFTALTVASGFSDRPINADIRLISSTEGVNGRFYAGAATDADTGETTATYTGAARRIDAHHHLDIFLRGEVYMTWDYPANNVFRPVLRPSVWQNNAMTIFTDPQPPTPTPGPRPTPRPPNPTPTPTPERFRDNEDGTVSDTVTGLMWIKEPRALTSNGALMTWSAAQTYVGNLNFAGYSDWRLPHVNRTDGAGGIQQPAELDAVGRPDGDLTKSWDRGMLNKAFVGLVEPHYWSNTTYEVGTGHAWRVYVGNGSLHVGNKSYANFVWPVRDED